MSLGVVRRTPLIRSRRLWVGVSLAAHLGVIAALLSVGPEPIRRLEPELMPVALVEPRYLPPPPPPPPKEEPAPKPTPQPPKPTPVRPPPRLHARRPVNPPPTVRPLVAAVGPVTEPGDELSDAELASATTAGTGGSGEGCNMVRFLEGKLRRDRGVQAAIAAAHRGKPILVWNGDWVRRNDQEGAGLATVREAIMWDVGFAPQACRSEPVRGLVLLRLDDGPGAPRVVLGTGAWRWTDLLFSRSSPRHGR